MTYQIKGQLVVGFLLVPLMMLTIALGAPGVRAQEQTSQSATADEEAGGTDAVSEPKFKDYKGVRIGMSADEVRKKLGKPETKGEKQDFFLISDNEIVQVFYDKDGKANAVSITYTGKSDSKPTALAVLGEDVPAVADGRVYKLVRYPTAGYWVAYSRSAGDAPIVSVTMKKLRVVSK
ncbi:MAG: hypothetical protein MSG64_17775 [Pyrinomonadaceae bacterium MAG19_C2-C3]|nr:hypothetical protein [Pyrinomonadaceae bacterium MAG19_C2-C3]